MYHSVTYADGANYCKLAQQYPIKTSPTKLIDKPTRGAIVGLSRRSAKRLRDLVNQIKRSASSVFITLTFPGYYSLTPSQAKTVFRSFTKRLRRLWPKFTAIWKVELKARQTGLSAGTVVPHYHMMAFTPILSTIKSKIRDIWTEVVLAYYRRFDQICMLDDKAIVDFRENGTDVRPVKNKRQANMYVSKYMSKSDEGLAADWAGRYWGIINYDQLPLGELITLTIGRVLHTRLQRIFRRLVFGNKPPLYAHLIKQLSCYLSDATLASVINYYATEEALA